MRRIFTLFAAVLLVASFAAAQSTSSTTQPAQKGKSSVGTAGKRMAKPMTMTGEVVKADANSLTIKGVKGESTFVLGSARITQGPKSLTASDLSAGEKVTVHYNKSGNEMQATRVIVARKPAPKEPKSQTSKNPGPRQHSRRLGGL